MNKSDEMGTEKSEERTRRMEKKSGKEPVAGDEQLKEAMGREFGYLGAFVAYCACSCTAADRKP